LNYSDNDWKNQSFKEIAIQVKELYTPNKNESFPYIGLEHIKKNDLLLDGVGKSDSTVSQKFKFKKNDILFGKLRPYFKKVVVADFDGVCSTDILVVRSKPGIDQLYLFYLMASQKFIVYSSMGSTGTKMPRAEWNYLEEFEQLVPDIIEQQKISSILHTLTEKIKNLVNQNNVLDKMSRAIYKSWFVTFDGYTEFEQSELNKIPKGWSVEPIEELSEFVKGFSYKGSEKSSFPTDYAFITLDNFKEGQGFKPKYSGIKSSRLKDEDFIQEGDVVIANTEQTKDARLLSTPALIFFPDDYKKTKGVFSHHVTKIIPKTDFLKYYLFFHFLYNQSIIANAYHTGTGVWALDVNGMKKQYLILSPEKNVIKDFSKLLQPLIQTFIKNQKEIIVLKKLRDSLIPKLISGDIRI
jgi:type I restriction enzyme, S subunit